MRLLAQPTRTRRKGPSLKSADWWSGFDDGGLPDQEPANCQRAWQRRQYARNHVILCVPKTLSVLMTPRNHLSWRNDRAPVFRRGGLMVGTTNISMAAMSGAWFRRKVRHPWLGGPRYLTMYLATLD